jgi:hypothetical protein
MSPLDLQAYTLTIFTRRARQFARDELPMAAQNRVGCDDRGDVGQHPSTQPLPTSREPATLRIGQPQTPADELTPKYSVFLDQIGDVLLLVSQSAGEHTQKIRKDARFITVRFYTIEFASTFRDVRLIRVTLWALQWAPASSRAWRAASDSGARVHPS